LELEKGKRRMLENSLNQVFCKFFLHETLLHNLMTNGMGSERNMPVGNGK
jgi:hypothetical protein